MDRLRKVAAVLAAHGQSDLAREVAQVSLTMKVAGPEIAPQLRVALMELVKAAELPAQVAKGPGSYPIPVPKGFESLFKSIHIDVRLSKNGKYIDVGWSYEHPSGSNGYRIGTAMADEEQSGYRLEDGRYKRTGDGMTPTGWT